MYIDNWFQGKTYVSSPEEMISCLRGYGVPEDKIPKLDLDLVKKAIGFWINQWKKRKVYIVGEEISIQIDPEEGFWYVVVKLIAISNISPRDFSVSQIDIIEDAVDCVNQRDWLTDYIVTTELDR